MKTFDSNNPYDVLYAKIARREELVRETESELLLIDAAPLLLEAEIIKENYEVIIPV